MKSGAREKIWRAAAELFAEKGYAATPTREICQRAGVTKPVLYYHFENKEQLFTGMVQEAWKECRSHLQLAARRGRSAREKLVDVLAADFALTKRDPGMATMLFRMIFAPQKETPNVDCVGIGLEWAGIMQGIVREGIRRGEMQGSAKQVGEAIVALDMIYTLSYLLTDQPKLDRKLARRIVDLLVKGCGANHKDR
jgi:AcrR family transcriptional regulator